MAIRPLVRPVLHPPPTRAENWWPVTDRRVRYFWTAVLGPAAVADLLRLVAAARSEAAIRRPHRLSALIEHRLVEWRSGTLYVSDVVPPPRVELLPRPLRHRLR